MGNEAGGKVDYCMAIFTYELRKSVDNFREAGCRLVTLSNFSTPVKVASEMGYISKSEKDAILEWSKDPAGWGKGNKMQ